MALKKNENKGDVELTLSQNPYIACSEIEMHTL